MNVLEKLFISALFVVIIALSGAISFQTFQTQSHSTVCGFDSGGRHRRHVKSNILGRKAIRGGKCQSGVVSILGPSSSNDRKTNHGVKAGKNGSGSSKTTIPTPIPTKRAKRALTNCIFR